MSKRYLEGVINVVADGHLY